MSARLVPASSVDLVPFFGLVIVVLLVLGSLALAGCSAPTAPPEEALDAGLPSIIEPMPAAPTPADEGKPGAWEPLPGIEPAGRMFVVAPEGEGPVKPLVLIHGAWGLDESARGLARDLAAAGYTVAAPDLYDGVVSTSRLTKDELLQGIGGDRALAMVRAAATRVREASGGAAARVAIVTMHAGAPIAMRAVSEEDSYAGLVIDSFLPQGEQAPAAALRCPAVLLIGENDGSLTPAVREEILADFEGLGSPLEIVTIVAAGTDLFDREAMGFSDVAYPEAIEATRAFLDRVLAATP